MVLQRCRENSYGITFSLRPLILSRKTENRTDKNQLYQRYVRKHRAVRDENVLAAEG